MSKAVLGELDSVLQKIDRPGSFCVSGSDPAVLPGLEVEGLGLIGFPLTATQAKELKKQCEQAPYGKGEETIVDTKVRRVWRLTPDRFKLTNPDWQPFLDRTVKKVQQELGLEKQKLESHLYDLLLYEKGSFFLPHRDGEKLDRMVATLVLVLPSAYEGGELVVRHEGEEKTIDFGSGDNNLFRIHHAAFYADCEHEIRPLRAGYRLCLVYNLTLKKGKESITAPRRLEYIEQIGRILGEWAKGDDAHRLCVMLEHQYTQEGLVFDALKGADRAKAQILQEAAQQAGCQAYLALLTFHESGSAEHTGGGGSYYGRRSRWGYGHDEDEDPSSYEMGEIYESSLTAEHWSDSNGQRLPIGTIRIDEGEILDEEALKEIEPEEEFEGYTGNAGMTLDRWYRHAAIFIWPNKKHFDILCDAGSRAATAALKGMVDQLRVARGKDAETLRAQCLQFAGAIIARWQENRHGGYSGNAEEGSLLDFLLVLDDPGLIKSYLSGVLARDVSVDPGAVLVEVCSKYGWKTFQSELQVIFQATTADTIERNMRFLDHFCLAKPRKKEGWGELCQTLAEAILQAVETIDQQAHPDYRSRGVNREQLLAGLAQTLLASEQFAQLSRLVAHVLARPEKYPLLPLQFAVLTRLEPWLVKNVKKPCPPLSDWIASCCAQLEALTENMPKPPADFRRPVTVRCTCKDCGDLKRFLDEPKESTRRFPIGQSQRKHVISSVEQCHCDIDCTIDRSKSPHVLVCTKNTASYQANLATYHENRERLAKLRAIEVNLPSQEVSRR